jgi:hypothetical protein
LSVKEGKTIGEGLALTLITNTTLESAIGEWVNRYPSLGELERRYGWFRPMMITLGKRVLKETHRRANGKLYIGATLSLLDTFFDIYMVIKFGNEGEWGYALFILATVLMNLLAQMFIVYIQNSKMGTKRLVREAVITVLALKPAVDAFRVANGEEKHPNMLFDSEVELGLVRVIEVVCESIPSSILQSYAFMKAEKKSKAAAASIIVSALTISFASSVISYDADVSPMKRRITPQFYVSFQYLSVNSRSDQYI